MQKPKSHQNRNSANVYQYLISRRQTRRVKLQANQSALFYLGNAGETDLQKINATHPHDPDLISTWLQT